jgi:probable addiction module antidote protein
MPRNRKYQDWLIEQLKDHDMAVAYLNEAFAESLKGDEESRQIFLMALRDVAEAQGGLGKLAKKAHVGRESLYKTLSKTGNPQWYTLVTLIMSLGLNLRFT